MLNCPSLGIWTGSIAAITQLPVVANYYNFTGTNLSIWQSAKSNVDSGVSNAPMLCVGDSTTAGQGSNGALTTNARIQSWPSKLAALLTNSNRNSIIGSTNIATYDLYDPRTTFGTGWGILVNSAGGPMFRQSSGGTGTFAFTPTSNVDTFEIWYPTNTALGTFTVNINGGATLATINENATPSFSKLTVTGTLGANTLNIQRSSGGDVYIDAVIAYNSAQKNALIQNAGWSGAKVADWVVNTLAWDPYNAVLALAPKLTLIGLTINDWNAGTSLTTYKANLTTLINACKISGNVILHSGAPSNPGAGFASLATQQTYVTAMYDTAYATGVPFIDVWSIFGGSWATANTNGWMFDNLHPNGTGYTQIANAFNTALASSFRAR